MTHPISYQEQLHWQEGYGVIKHTPQTVKRVSQFVDYLEQHAIQGDGVAPYALLKAADYITSAAMWLVVHQTYASRVYLDGRILKADDFKDDPQGHLGGTLNMIPAYVGYLAANVLTGITRSWVMEQGHAVAAVDAVNLIISNMTKAHAERYALTDEGVTRFAQDFYAYRMNAKGQQDSPLGSHVNPHTAGGHLEGGYLGFASVQYAHMPLKSERLVAFLSDGAFEEQRGADWTSRWWRSEDSGLVVPIMIANGRRIDQRSTMAQEGGASWFKKYLQLHGFKPMIFDGKDPAAFVWAIIEQERQLQEAMVGGTTKDHYRIAIPYGIAVAPKGAGFYNAGTNYAHNLPLVDNPKTNVKARSRFHRGVKKLYVPPVQLKQAITLFQKHNQSGRVVEKDHPVANRHPVIKTIPDIAYRTLPCTEKISAMDAIDLSFITTVKANPHLRPRVGNPDEMLSNRMDDTLKALSFRVEDVEEGMNESTLGDVITALNEEAVAGAAFGNKGGINIIVSYEAFGAKMFGQMRQEVIFAKHQKESGKPAGWLSVPVVMTSNTWENSKNELSHQDPSLAESMLVETSDISRVIFPADYNSAAHVMKTIYKTTGQLWTIIVAKQKTSVFLTPEESEQLMQDGAIRLYRYEHKANQASIALVAVGSYQLQEVLSASKRLRQADIPYVITYIIEPGRFRLARNEGEQRHLASEKTLHQVMPRTIEHVILVCHTRTELMMGVLHPLWSGRTIDVLGFINQGGTLGIDGMLFVNRTSWLHILSAIVTRIPSVITRLLKTEEVAVLSHMRSPDGIVTNLDR